MNQVATMSSRSNRLFTMTGPPEHYDPPYAVYDNSFQQPFPRTAVPPAHFDGMAFWYRPDPQEAVFDHNKMLYNQNIPVVTSPLEQPLSIKHRRTRSGCFTCRHRRVKCDETRPVCERCKKGNRECQFPQPSSSSRRSDVSDPRPSFSKRSSYEEKTESSQTLHTIEDEESEEGNDGSISPTSDPSRPEARNHQYSRRPVDPRRRHRRKSDVGDTKREESPQSTGIATPTSRAGTPASVSSTTLTGQQAPTKTGRWKHLNLAMQKCLEFHHEHITSYHYFLKLDPNDFVHNDLIDQALSFEPLLHAVVGFAAYHQIIARPNGRFQEFWKHYCQSIMLLRKWLESHTERNEAVLLTILQLATFEEYLGDWASLASHHKAAQSIFNTLYNYDNIMSTATSRCIFDWLARADVAVGLMAGTSSSLDRQWFTTALEWHQDQVDPDVIEAKTALPCLVAKLRLIGFDMATVFASATTNANVIRDIRNISKGMDDLRLQIQALHTTTTSTRTVPRAGDSGRAVEEDAFDARVPLFRGTLWPLNFLWVDWYATEQMHKYQTALLQSAMQTHSRSQRENPSNSLPSGHFTPPVLPPELENLSLVQCQIFEAIERSPYAPSGAILGCQASLALSSVFLRRVPKYTMWARRKLANIERLGYIWPPSFRKRMAQLWNDDEILDWWLPDDELKIGLLDEIREVVEERNREIEGRGGDERDDVRDMKAVFDRLDFGQTTLRGRKDSVWSAAGNNQSKESDKMSSSGESDDSEEDDTDEEEAATRPTRRNNRDSGIDTSPATGPVATNKGGQPVLEYSNRMSGIWEGPAP